MAWRGRLAWGAMALAVAFGASPAAAQQAAEHPPKKPFPQVWLNKRMQGEDAIKGLGGKLPVVADWYGKSAADFARELRQDKRAWLDRDGRLLFIDDFPTPANADAVTAGATTTAAAPFPTDQTFLLHSRPGAKRVIYLDFLGQVVSGTAWNSSYGLSAIDAKPFDLDGLPSSLSTTELERIQYIWQRVAEDYAPFDVDVTTQEPAAAAITRSSNTDAYFGTRVVITQDWTALTTHPCGCGGIAYVGTFDDTTDGYKPAWVFFNRLGSGNEKYVAEAISHEAGHNLGLSHDGTSTTGYYAGHGSGATGWAPIMGVGYYKELVQWSRGEYPGATQTQDDLQIIQNTGAPLRPDDHGDTAAAATPLDAVSSGGVVSLEGSGLIGTRADVDVFSFSAGPGALNLTVKPASRGPNLDIHARLYDAAGNLLASSGPTDTLDASLSVTTAAAGTYRLFVEGTGKGDLTTGYSDYASLGEYTITGSAPDGGQAPVAAAAAAPTTGPAPLTVNFSSAGSYDPDGGTLTYDWDFGDGAAHSSSPNPSHSYGAGSYTAILRVTDTSGASDTSQVNVTATATQATTHVSNIAMSLLNLSSGAAQARATVTVLNANGQQVSGATVTGNWSGIVSGTSSRTTDSAGKATLTSASTQKTGTLTFTVTGVTAAGFTYDAAVNIETTDSITR
jgi:PKD repeat protein